jgi:hypothetical protein
VTADGYKISLTQQKHILRHHHIVRNMEQMGHFLRGIMPYKYPGLGRAITQAIDSFPPQRPVFYLRSSHVGFVVDKVALGQVSSEQFDFPCQF